LWVEIVKGENIFIAIDDLGRNLTFNNFAEDAVGI
jgi:hypothetical protein